MKFLKFGNNLIRISIITSIVKEGSDNKNFRFQLRCNTIYGQSYYMRSIDESVMDEKLQRFVVLLDPPDGS